MPETQTKEPMAQCPMASMCKGMAEKPHSRLVLILPGLMFILVGVLILVEPKIPVWLMAAYIKLSELCPLAAFLENLHSTAVL